MVQPGARAYNQGNPYGTPEVQAAWSQYQYQPNDQADFSDDDESRVQNQPYSRPIQAREEYYEEGTRERTNSIFGRIFSIVDYVQCQYLRVVDIVATPICDGIEMVFGAPEDEVTKGVIHIAAAALGMYLTAPLGTWNIPLRIAAVVALYLQSKNGNWEWRNDKKTMFEATALAFGAVSLASVGASAAVVIYENAATTAHVIALGTFAFLMGVAPSCRKSHTARRKPDSSWSGGFSSLCSE